MLVRDFTDGLEIDQALLVRGLDERTKSDGEPFLRLTLGDRTGGVVAMVWDDVEALRGSARAASVVRVRGLFEVHQRWGAQLKLRGIGRPPSGTLRHRRPARRPAARG